MPTSPLYVRLYNFLRNGGRKFFWGGGSGWCVHVCVFVCVFEGESARARGARERERWGHIDVEWAWESKGEGMCYIYVVFFFTLS